MFQVLEQGESMTDWEDDCMEWHGRVLTGKFQHWCDDWDYLPIDTSCEEINICLCTWYNIDQNTYFKIEVIEVRGVK